MNDLRADLDALNQRISRLEHQNRRLQQAGLAAIVLGLLVLLPGVLRAGQKLELHPVPPASQARNAVTAPVFAPEFVVQDAHGKVRAVLNSKGLFLFGSNRQMRVWLTPEDLVYKGEDGRIRVALKASSEGSSFVVRDAQGDESNLGNTILTQPGATEHRSAASLVFLRQGTIVKQFP